MSIYFVHICKHASTVSATGKDHCTAVEICKYLLVAKFNLNVNPHAVHLALSTGQQCCISGPLPTHSESLCSATEERPICSLLEGCVQQESSNHRCVYISWVSIVHICQPGRTWPLLQAKTTVPPNMNRSRLTLTFILMLCILL